MSAMMGTLEALTISGSAAVDSSSGHDTRTKSAPASSYCKDKKGKYLEVNDFFVYISTFAKAADIAGQTDSDLPWKDQAALMSQNDKKTIHANKSGIFLEDAFCVGDKIRSFLSYKVPLLNRSGKRIGIIGASFLALDKFRKISPEFLSSEKDRQLVG